MSQHPTSWLLAILVAPLLLVGVYHPSTRGAFFHHSDAPQLRLIHHSPNRGTDFAPHEAAPAASPSLPPLLSAAQQPFLDRSERALARLSHNHEPRGPPVLLPA